jgi:predicted Ser/Thr protein kinase
MGTAQKHVIRNGNGFVLDYELVQRNGQSRVTDYFINISGTKVLSVDIHLTDQFRESLSQQTFYRLLRASAITR